MEREDMLGLGIDTTKYYLWPEYEILSQAGRSDQNLRRVVTSMPNYRSRVKELMKGLKSEKAAGNDGVSPSWYLKTFHISLLLFSSRNNSVL